MERMEVDAIKDTTKDLLITREFEPGVDIIGAKYLGDVAAPSATVSRGDVPASLVASVDHVLRNRQMWEEMTEVMQVRAPGTDSALIHSQLLELYLMCETEIVQMPSFTGDYVPVIQGEEGPGFGTVFKPGENYVNGDVLVTHPNGNTTLSRIGCDSSTGVIVIGLGPRTHQASDGDSALAKSDSPKVTDIVRDFDRCKRAGLVSIAAIEGCLFEKYGARAADLESSTLSKLLGELRASQDLPTSHRPTSHPEVSPASHPGFPDVIAQKAPSTSGVDLADMWKALQSATSRLSSSPSSIILKEYKDGVLARYRKAGMMTESTVLKRASGWKESRGRGVHVRMGSLTPKEIGSAHVVAESRMDIISTQRAEVADDMYALESIDDFNEHQADREGPESETLTPSARLALLACTEVFQRLGFSLDAPAVRRSSDAALIDCIDDESSFEARVESHRQRLQLAGKVDVDADIVAREVCARNLIRDAPENLVVFAAFYLMSAMVTCTSETGRLCISKLNHFHRESFSTRTAFSSEPPSLVSYVANVAHSVKKFGDVTIKWRQSPMQISERLALLSKSKKLNRSAMLMKLRNLKVTVIPPSLLSNTQPHSSDMVSHKYIARSRTSQAFSSYPLVGAPTHTKRLKLSRQSFFPPNLEPALINTDTVAMGTTVEPFPDISRDALRLVKDKDAVAHIQHIVAPVSIVYMTSDPLPSWAASLLRKDKTLARLVDTVRKDSLLKRVVPSPMSNGSHETLVHKFIADAMAVSPAFLDMLKMLGRHLAPIEAPDARLRMRPLSFERARSTSGDSGRSRSLGDSEPIWGDLDEEFDMFCEEAGEL
jgi:hypothetical protein